MTIETYIRAQLARIAVEEGGRYGGLNNMRAVAMVLRNRVFAGWGSWLDVIDGVETRPINTAVPRFNPLPVLKSGMGRLILNQVDEIYSRTDLEDITGGALFWYDPAYPAVEWFVAEVLARQEQHRRVAHIGPVWFFQ